MSDLAQELIDAYHLLALWGLDDHTYTHLSCRLSQHPRFYLPRFGIRFEEACLADLLEVGIEERTVVAGTDTTINTTAYGLHADVYARYPRWRALFHLHTPEMVAVSAHPEGLLPLSQWALHFYERVGYYKYDSLLLEPEQSQPLLEALGSAPVLFLRHHGVLIAGRTIAEAVYYTHHLQQACRTQCLILSSTASPVPISRRVAEKSVRDLLGFEEHLGQRDWQAWKRYLQRHRGKC